MMHGWIAWIIIGILAGAAARMLVPGEVGGGILMDLIVGLLGACIGGWLISGVFGLGGAGGGLIWSIIVAVIGAVVFLLVLRLLSGRRPVP